MKQLTTGDRSSSAPRWSPDGKKIAFTTGSQIWVMDSDGDNKEQVTKISTGAAGPVWSPDGNGSRLLPTSIPIAMMTTATRNETSRRKAAKSKRTSSRVCSINTGMNGAT